SAFEWPAGSYFGGCQTVWTKHGGGGGCGQGTFVGDSKDLAARLQDASRGRSVDLHQSFNRGNPEAPDSRQHTSRHRRVYLSLEFPFHRYRGTRHPDVVDRYV